MVSVPSSLTHGLSQSSGSRCSSSFPFRIRVEKWVPEWKNWKKHRRNIIRRPFKESNFQMIVWLIFYPIWVNWACFAPGSTARHQFFSFTAHSWDAPPWGTWLRTLYWWRKVGKDRRRREKSQQLAGFIPKTSGLRGVCSTSALQTWLCDLLTLLLGWSCCTK